MKKTLKILYLVVMYIIGMPFYVIMMLGLIAWMSIDNLIQDGETYLKDTLMGCWTGFVTGHEINMEWVNK